METGIAVWSSRTGHRATAQFMLLPLSVLLVALAALLLPADPARAQEGYTFEECSALEPAALQAEVEALALDVLNNERTGIDVAAVVQQQWILLNVDVVLDAEIARAVDAVMVDESYWQRFWSGWSPQKAEEFTEEIAAEVLMSAGFGAKLEELAGAIAAELTAELEAMAAQSASSSLLCLQEYVGQRYAATLFDLFQQEVSADMAAVADNAEGNAGGDVAVSAVSVHNKALTGVGVIVVSQIVRRLSVQLSKKIAGRVVGRITGRVLGRLGSSFIPVAGWLIGGGLIAWDLIEGGKGALPQIEEALQGPEFELAVQQEVALAVEEGLTEQVHEIATLIAANMVAEWSGFCARHPLLCTLPQENGDFRQVLATTPVDGLDNLSALVQVFLDQFDRETLDQSLTTGLFEQLLALPPAAVTILQRTGSAELAMAWADLAGAQLDEAVDAGLDELLDPATSDADELERLLALNDMAAIQALAALPASQRRALTALPMAPLRALGNTFTTAELADLVALSREQDESLSELAAAVLESGLSPAQWAAESEAARVVSTPPPGTIDAVSPPVGPATDLSWRQNSVIVASTLLMGFLALCAFGIVVVDVVKRRQRK
ncbi:MAG: hypothetical protein KDD78_11545 [Caldilineaceae bacterium]|nr:hypothetical protein [Caldilineaceae bacterium]